MIRLLEQIGLGRKEGRVWMGSLYLYYIPIRTILEEAIIEGLLYLVRAKVA